MARDDDEQRRLFSEYFAARHDTVRRTAYLLCGDWHWADDLAQIAFVRLAAGWHTIRDPAALDAFVRTCLMRAYLSETRRVWRRRERTTPDPPDRAGVDGVAESSIRRLHLREALRKLGPRQRATLVCRFYLSLDIAATAAVLGCTEGTVKSQTARGLAALRANLESDADGQTDEQADVDGRTRQAAGRA